MNLKLQLYRIVTLCLITVLLFNSCKKSIDSGWETNYLTPILSGNLTILDMLPDSITQVNPDQSIDLIFNQNIVSYDLAGESINVPDTSVSYTVSLDSLKLEDRVLVNNISLGAVAIALGFPIGTYIILNNGNEIPLDPIIGFSSGPQPIDATSFFETATFSAGSLDIEIKNGFPIDLTNVDFQISNLIAGDIIVTQHFDTIYSGEVKTSHTDLAGKTVEGTLIAEITNFDSPGSAPDSVSIDTSDALIITMTVYDMELFEATAVFPEQNLINNIGNVTYDLGGPELTEMKIGTGNVVIYIQNTIQDSIHVIYDLPYAVSASGETVHIETVVGPAIDSDHPTTVNQIFPLADYTVDLRGSYGNSFNTFYQEFSAAINYTGEVRHISLADSLTVVYGLQDIVPLELKGYVGQITQHLSDTTAAISLFDKIVDGTINFGDVDIALKIANGMGVSGNIIIHTLKTVNTKTGEEATLIAPTIIEVPQNVNRALNEPYIPGYSTISLNTSNSNIVELLNILPDQLIYDVDLNVNPNGNEFNYQDFIIAGSRINLDLDLEMPLEFFASNLTLQNDFDINLGTSETNTAIEGLNSTELTLYANNGFPLDASISIVFKDDFGVAIDSINFNGDRILPANIDIVDCKVHEIEPSILKQIVTGDQLANIITSKSAQLTVKFNTATTSPCSDIVKIYSNYGIELHLTGMIDYLFSTKNF